MQRILALLFIPGVLSACILLDEGLGISPPNSQSGELARNRIRDGAYQAYLYGCAIWATNSQLHIATGGSTERTRFAGDCLTGDPNLIGNVQVAINSAVNASGVKKSATYKKASVDDCSRQIATLGFSYVQFYFKGQETENFVTENGSLVQKGVALDDNEFTVAASMVALAAQECVLEETNPVIETGL